ncbi:MAG: acetyl-CoA carboxylase biotin carboxyl carrier protein subunit [Deltaproteobacteria bacterium]|nr:acetyl-CoA carboxylase biotin carboxyl carrier protein subunit [Deltaproteobacteria bacterium]
MDMQEFLVGGVEDRPQLVRVELGATQGQYVIEIEGVRHTVDARWLGGDGYRQSRGPGDGTRALELSLISDFESHHVALTRSTGPRFGAQASDHHDADEPSGGLPDAVYHVLVGNTPIGVAVSDARRARLGATVVRKVHKGPITVKSPMPGRISKVVARLGESIEQGAPLVTIEAMKMENEIRAPRSGTVREIMVEVGHTVDSGARLLTIDSE